MSFGSSGFGGFGSNNNQTSSGFGSGFGSNNNNSGTGFGSNTGGGFGQSTNTGGGVFGNATQSGFGSPSGGFGSNAGGGFGSKPAFGSSNTAGGGLFGASNANNTTSNSGFGGFGSTNNANSSPFGGGNTTGGGLFGNSANKTGFGAAANTGSSLFGATNTSSGGGFGGSGFGAASNPAAAVGDPPGTGATPFTAFVEKEPNSTNQSNSFQNILFQDPYRKWSAEELRLADYVQGRRHGNANGAGAFGVNSGFGGGFGSNNNQTTNAFGTPSNAGGGLFGAGNASTNNNAGGFGQAAAGAFGANSGNASGGLFGNSNKPSGGLFGNPTTQQSSGLFGSGTGGGFGANNNNNTSAFGGTANTAGGLFGSSNQANKPQGTGFSFGNANANNTTSAFGGSNTGGAFGTANSGNSGLFGASNNQQSSGGLFGNAQQQQQPNTNSPFGSGFGAQNQSQNPQGLFGNAQQKPASSGLFGAATTTTTPTNSLFGSANNQQQGTSAFGTNNTAATGGLFGAPKPSATTSLFGAPNANQANSTGTGLFGALGSNNQAQPTTGSSLFGTANNTQQKPGGLFGTTNQASGSSLFGGTNNQVQGNSLFGNGANQQQTQSSGFGGSLLGGTQQLGNAPQGLTANLNDVSAYGSPSLFAGLSGNEVSNPGPLATPLNSSSKPRRSSILPMYKLAPSTASRFATPQKRGFGFSYSSFGTPGASPAGSISSTPGGLGRSLLGPGGSGTLSKSMSTNNLRRSFAAEDSILAPGAFSSSSNGHWYGSTGSKKLVINRDIRSDLFSSPQRDKQSVDGAASARKLSKRVSFDTSNVEDENGTPPRNALPASEDTPSSETQDSTPRQNRSLTAANGMKTPDMEHVKGNELAIVHEEDHTATPESPDTPSRDRAPGQYWMNPDKEGFFNMNRMQRQRIAGFSVGRENVGHITFKLPVDISGINIDDICGTIVVLEPRSATVYPNQAKKPPVGRGLNVPATILLEQSWPRGGRQRRSSGDFKRFSRHVERLREIPDTTFESFDESTGTWVFSVEHFTTYGLKDESDYESDEDDEGDLVMTAPTARSRVVSESSVNPASGGESFSSSHSRDLPGAFDGRMEPLDGNDAAKPSFFGNSSADLTSNNVQLSLEEYDTHMDDGYDVSEDEDVARSSVGHHRAAEQEDSSPEADQEPRRATPGGILRARMRAMKDSIGPVRLEVPDGDDWMSMLMKTVSPAKRDRQQLREQNETPSKRRCVGNPVGLDEDDEVFGTSSMLDRSPSKAGQASAAMTKLAMDKGQGFATSIDLMNSLFDKSRFAKTPVASTPKKGLPEWPYERQDKSWVVGEAEQSYHNASRPTWGPGEVLVVTRSLETAQSFRNGSNILAFQLSGIQTQLQDVRLAKFSITSSQTLLLAQQGMTEIGLIDGVPMATLHVARLRDLFHHQDVQSAANVHEKHVWELSSILFDRLAPSDASDGNEDSTRKTMLSKFWTDLVEQASTTSLGLASCSEERAMACVAGHRILDACKHLVEGKNFHLGTLLPLIGTSDKVKREMREQLKAWHDSKMLSEFSDSIRAIYELLGGNACVCEGMKAVPIEDRMDSFVIAKKFGLDWRQSFGLRLWYAINEGDGAAAAVKMFEEDLSQDKEEAPRPWFIDEGFLPQWNDAHAEDRQDLLWGLLRLYADEQVDLEAVLRPENSQLSPFNMRLCWQLGVALVSTGKVSFGKDGAEKADAATVAYATQLTAAGEWLDAVFVLLHLSDAKARAKAIQEHLCRHAGLIGAESEANFTKLVDKYRVPATWIWEAKALYIRSVERDASGEVHCLLRAGSFAEAHRVLVQQVAPRAIIERDYAALSALVDQMKEKRDSISGWALGGQVYSNFLSLMQHRERAESVAPSLLEKMMGGLRAMSEAVGEAEIERYAAVSDMADETAREILKLSKKKQDTELRARILGLPLTQDRLLAYSLDMAYSVDTGFAVRA
ncbi:nucleoporin SONB [Ophiocordyceps camponoti-floridani]|uniref:Nucleoporin SONB n=1 Tax=Ophiocordyceps camponoti-floridani TaxID=2030778 RepID=A0A8H4QDK6_9HYPO|nr:nucleoporin SONB [Ophiocordyceps camponoti-floridani]